LARISDILEQRAQFLLIAIGLALIVLGNGFEKRILKIQIDLLIVEVGALLLIVGILHWVYESTVRRQLVQEIVETVVGAGRLSTSGIVDFRIHSRDVNYTDMIRHAKTLTIGEHFSPRIFEDFAPHFRHRHSSGLETVVLLLKAGSPAETYMKENFPGFGNNELKIERIRVILQDTPGTKHPALKLKWHRQILRYSFVLTEESIWVRFYRNSFGFSLVPAICIAKGSPIYEFFAEDVKALTQGAEDEGN
jgi:hypothetical protein